MKKIGILIFLSVSFILHISCNKSPACKGDDKNNGMIEKYYRMHDFPMCVEAFVNENGTMVIRSGDELSAITDSNCINYPEAGYSNEPPQIDFSEYSLLGFWTTGGGCNIRFIREVSRDDTNNKYLYEIRVNECGSCEMLRYDANFVLVPRLPDGYTVDFIVF